MSSKIKNSSFSPDRDFILETLNTAVGVKRTSKIWNEICHEHNINPNKEKYVLEELENIFISLIDRGGLLRVCGKSLLVRLASYTNLDKKK